MSAPVRIEAEAWTDLRFATLARILGLAEADHALIRTARIWSWQAEHYTPEAPTYVVDLDTVESALGAGGAAALVRARLAEDAPGGYRIRGATGRIEWLWQRRQSARAGGEATKRKHGNKQGPGGQPDGRPTAEPVLSPLVPALVPDLPEDQSSLPPAIPPTAVPEPEPTPVPAVSPPAPHREDIAGTQPKYAREPVADSSFGPKVCDLVVSKPTRNTPENMRAAPRGEAPMIWRDLEAARAEVGVELGLQILPLPIGDRGERDLADMFAAARARGPAEVETLVRQARHAIAMAKAETIAGDKSPEWLTGAVFAPGNFRRLVAKVARKRADPKPPAAPRKSNPQLQVSTLTSEERLALAAESRAKLYGPAAMPTAELVKRFGDGQRAPPESARPTSPDPDEKHARKAAT